ncbi:MAG: CDC27 family protein [Schwartzia sp.]|nr:CDC27 family protein [Schwartzia sp. (in: firmicutes)]MBR1886305.1 CDC27 family protein [Schwartzia sp. (in: firmicutes)]
MGKASRKLKKRQQQEEVAGRQEEIKETEQKLLKQLEDGAYTDALDSLAELAGKKSVSPQAMYAGAYAYFMLGDYDRAATWIDNTLRFAPNHVAARILLARLCILQEKTDSGLAIFELLTDKFLPGLSEEERDEIEALAGFFGRNEPEKIAREYPHLAAFLRVGEEEAAEENAGVSDDGDAFAVHQDMATVMGLKLPSFSAAETSEIKDASVVAAEEKPQAQKQETGKSALEVLRNLKAKIDARVHGEEATSASGTPKADEARGENEVQARAGAVVSSTAAPSGASGEAREKLRDVCEGQYSIVEKARLLNSFAGGYYAQGDLDAAELFLTEALKIDDTDENLIRNLAVLLADKGEKDKAFKAAARLRRTDFLLLYELREM